MSSSQATKRPSTSTQPSICVICQQPRSKKIAHLLPCSHKFDLECVSDLLYHSSANPLCPLDRTPISEIRYNYRRSGNFEIYAPGLGHFDSSLMTASTLRGEKGEIRYKMTPKERSRLLAYERMRRLPDYSPPSAKYGFGFAWCRIGSQIVWCERALEVGVIQKNGEPATRSEIQRTVTVKKMPANLGPDYIDMTHPPEPTEVAKAQKEVAAALAAVGNPQYRFSIIKIQRPRHTLWEDERGLTATVCQTLQILKAQEAENIEVSKTTTLSEVFHVMPKKGTDDGLANGLSKQYRERAVRLARDEMQGAIEFLVGTASYGYKPLEKASTGIMEKSRRDDCEHCPEKHRNGDCLLPWK